MYILHTMIRVMEFHFKSLLDTGTSLSQSQGSGKGADRTVPMAVFWPQNHSSKPFFCRSCLHRQALSNLNNFNVFLSNVQSWNHFGFRVLGSSLAKVWLVQQNEQNPWMKAIAHSNGSPLGSQATNCDQPWEHVTLVTFKKFTYKNVALLDLKSHCFVLKSQCCNVVKWIIGECR